MTPAEPFVLLAKTGRAGATADSDMTSTVSEGILMDRLPRGDS